MTGDREDAVRKQGDAMAHDREAVSSNTDMGHDGALAHLYVAMYCLVALGEAGGSGAVTRAARIGQVELWPVIEHLGGSARAFTDWREAHEQGTTDARGGG